MGLLEADGRQCALGPDQLIGREPSAALRLDDESVSWRHASVRWTGNAWELQDLGSTNGTFVNGQRIAPGARAVLRLGFELRFGDARETWRLASADPPATSVVELATGQRLFALDDLIAIPPTPEPELFLSRQAGGVWIAEQGERVWEPTDLEVFRVGASQYRFEPSAPVHATRAGGQLTPGTLRLEFAVSRNEEHVEITIVHRERRTPLRPRAHGYLLLTLARQRAKDQADPKLAAESHGWIYQEQLVKMLATTPTQLAVDIYRARQQFNEAGVADAAQLVERRSMTHELRLGVPQISIRSN
jgi:predicted component of type VI protein secretion system